MSFERGIQTGVTGGEVAGADTQQVGKRTLVESIQLRSIGGRAAHTDPAAAQAAGARGTEGAGGKLPHLEELQRAFGDVFDLSTVTAHVGGEAATASAELGAEAYAMGDHVAFASPPSLHTAAHEAAHVVQQRDGVQLLGGMGADGDAYERQADSVADAVVRGESVAGMLGGRGGSSTKAVQLRQIAPTERRPALAPGDTDAQKDGKGVIAGLQGKLGVPITGVMDDATTQAVSRLQTAQQLEVSSPGSVDAVTWGAIEGGGRVVATSERAKTLEVVKVLETLDPKLRKGIGDLLLRAGEARTASFFQTLANMDTSALAHVIAGLNSAPPEQLEELGRAFLETGSGPRMIGGPEREPLVDRSDPSGALGANIPDALVDAHIADYTASSSYLQEAEGNALALHDGVVAQVFDQPNPGEKIIRNNGVQYGNAGTAGILLFVGGNHYVTLNQVGDDAQAYDYIDLERHKYTKGTTTRADGHCLIDGLFIIANHHNASDPDIADARAHIAQQADRGDVEAMLTAAVSDLMHGEFPQGLGPNVFRMLRSDGELWEMFTRAQAAARQKPKAESASGEPVVGMPGVAYGGPVKRPNGEVIHRAECEVEMVGSVPHVRLYLTICKEATMGGVQPDGTYAASFKDVQQDLATGKLQISPGNNGVMYVTGGQALRSLKWAAKYVVQHRDKEAKARQTAATATATAQHAQATHDALPWWQRVGWQVIHFIGKKIGVSDPSWLAVSEKQTATANAAQQEVTEMQGLQAPIIRSYLFPLAEFNAITDDSILENEVGQPGNQNKTYNVDRHTASNQYAFRGDDVGKLATGAKDNSLKTYAWDQSTVTPEKSGELHPIQDLYDQFGVPFHDPGESPWTSGGGFIERDGLESKAAEYNMYFVTWRQSPTLDKAAKPAPDPLLAESIEKLPFHVRVEKTRTFLASRNIPEAEWPAYMQQVILPLSSEPMKEHVIATDYEQLNHDDNVRPSGEPAFSNDYAGWRADAEARRTKLASLGARLDTMIDDRRSPQALIDAIVEEFPELGPKYDKVCTKGGEGGDNYTFYNHAQMVLGQFMKIVSGEADKERLIGTKVLAKMVLFHDMEKMNSINQFVDHPGGNKKLTPKEEKVGEHRRTVETMHEHKELWGRDAKGQQDFRAAVAIADSDPFGDYMKKKITPAEAFRDIVGVARRGGIGQADYPRFFREFHQFYQADFSSYSDKSSYTPKGEDAPKSGKKSAGQKAFEAPEGGEHTRTPHGSGQRLIYTGELEAHFDVLAAMFATADAVETNLLALMGVVTVDDAEAKRLARKDAKDKALEKARKKKEDPDAEDSDDEMLGLGFDVFDM